LSKTGRTWKNNWWITTTTRK